MTRFGSVLAAAALAVATTVLPGLTVAPAEAAVCSDAGGVTVVVDRGSLDSGSTSQTCVAGGGNDAATLFAEAGHELERVLPFQGAVCRIDGAPADADCSRMPPTNRYWGLFWSNGKSGSWVYSSSGVDSLDVPAGGSVAFAWQSSSSRRNPAVKPPDHDGSGTDDPGGGSGGGSGGGAGGSGGGGRTGGGSGGGADDSSGGAPSDAPSSSSPSASDSPTSDAPRPADGKQAGKRDRDKGAKDAKRDRLRQQQSESAEPTEEATVSPDAAPVEDVAATPVSQGGLPLWLVGVAAAGLLAVGTTVAVVRRRATHDA